MVILLVIMPRLSHTERMQVIAIFYEIINLDVRNKSKKVAEIAGQRNINISEEGVRLILSGDRVRILFTF